MLKFQWADFMRADERTNKGKLKRPTRQDVLTWVGKAWDSVSEAVIEESFKSCGISNALNGSENGMFNESLASAVGSNCEVLPPAELCGLLFNNDSDSDESFGGFSDSEDAE